MSVYYQVCAQGDPGSKPPLQVGDVVEFHKYFEFKFVEGMEPFCVGEVLQFLYDQKQALVELKMLVRAEYDSPFKSDPMWNLCEPTEMTLKLDSREQSRWYLHESFESFLEKKANIQQKL